jgi:hypothetical protein
MNQTRVGKKEAEGCLGCRLLCEPAEQPAANAQRAPAKVCQGPQIGRIVRERQVAQ